MEKRKWINVYLKGAIVFGIVGWTTFFLAGALFVLGYHTDAYYMGLFSIFVGWFVSGYFWFRYGISQGKSIKEIVRDRLPWSKTKKR